MGFFSLLSHFKTKQAGTAAFLVYNSLFVLVVLEAARENPPWENNRLSHLIILPRLEERERKDTHTHTHIYSHYIFMYTCTYTRIHIHIYVYMGGERKREWGEIEMITFHITFSTWENTYWSEIIFIPLANLHLALFGLCLASLKMECYSSLLSCHLSWDNVKLGHYV